MRKILALCFASSLLVALSACSAGSSSSNQTVSAQTTYSTSSATGTYSIEYMCTYCDTTGTGNSYDSGVGTLQLNGSGAITGGTLNIYNSYATTPCVYSVTGTYSIQSTTLGTASLSLSATTKVARLARAGTRFSCCRSAVQQFISLAQMDFHASWHLDAIKPISVQRCRRVTFTPRSAPSTPSHSASHPQDHPPASPQ